MKSRKDLLDLRELYSKRQTESLSMIEKFRGTDGEQEWHIQFFMARGKVELLNYLLNDSE